MTAAEFIARSALPAFGDPRDGLPRDLVTPFSAFDLDGEEPFLVCVHKGFTDRVPVPFLLRAMGASAVAHVDEVYIVFEVTPVTESDDARARAFRSSMHGKLRTGAASPR